MCMVNAHIVYQETKGSKQKIRKFREEVALALLHLPKDPPKVKQRHILVPLKNANNKEVYRTCKWCYQKLSDLQGRAAAKKKDPKLQYFCSGCPNKLVMCIACFAEVHK